MLKRNEIMALYNGLFFQKKKQKQQKQSIARGFTCFVCY
jgi:hypothetical protein